MARSKSPVKNQNKPKSAANGKLGGRPKGAVNKATADIRLLAQKYGPDAVKELFRLATKATSEAARVAALRELLDRGYGKSPQPLVGDSSLDAIQARVIEWTIVDP